MPKTPKMALISEYLAADSSPDASADALCIIDIGYSDTGRCRPIHLFSFPTSPGIIPGDFPEINHQAPLPTPRLTIQSQDPQLIPITFLSLVSLILARDDLFTPSILLIETGSAGHHSWQL